MGIRMDQFIGLTDAAQEFLRENEAYGGMCPTCKQSLPRILQQVGSFTGMFDQEYPLFQHTLKDGCTADEFLQTSPWSSGPMFFLGLRVSDGREFLWAEEEITSYT